jgi:hypothetical protein
MSSAKEEQMSSQVKIIPTKFVAYDLDGNEKGESFGFRVYDDYDEAWMDGYDKDCFVEKSTQQVIDFVKFNSGVAAILENADGVWIGDHYHPMD